QELRADDLSVVAPRHLRPPLQPAPGGLHPPNPGDTPAGEGEVRIDGRPGRAGRGGRPSSRGPAAPIDGPGPLRTTRPSTRRCGDREGAVNAAAVRRDVEGPRPPPPA